MEIEKQVCTADQALDFKELGIDQNSSLFMWVADSPTEPYEAVITEGYNWGDYPGHSTYRYQKAAFTSSELGI